jgi:hypothetical protein
VIFPKLLEAIQQQVISRIQTSLNEMRSMLILSLDVGKMNSVLKPPSDISSDEKNLIQSLFACCSANSNRPLLAS